MLEPGPHSALPLDNVPQGNPDNSPESTVFVVDDDPAMRKSMRWLIESIELPVETFASAREFLEHYQPDRPGCVILDVRMPEMSGLELQEHMANLNIVIPIIIVTAYGDVTMAVRAMKAGALDFIEKPVSDQVLLDHIQKAIAEDRKRREALADHKIVLERIEKLTNRESEVMDYVVEGDSSREIAEKLGVSFKTIEAHRAKIMKKMEAKSVPQLIRMSLLTKDQDL